MKLYDKWRHRLCSNFVHTDVVRLGEKVGLFHFDIVRGLHGDKYLLNFEASVQ